MIYIKIEEGILQKSDVRESLFKTGLITLEPEDVVSIGVPHELFPNGQVAIINLDGTTLTVGDSLIVRKQGVYSRAKIESLQVDGKDVGTCNAGEVGIKLDVKLKQGSELLIRKA